MRNRKIWRNRFIGGATVGVAVMTATLVMSGTAFAGITIPAYPTVGAYPQWFTANNSASNIIRGDGSDTTFPMMQQLSDQYNQSGLNGCQLVSSGADENAFCSTAGTAPDYSNVATSDPADNFDSTEVLEGDNDVGSGNGQGQLCGTIPTPQTINFSRSSKPISAISGCDMIEAGYAKDSVPVTDVQDINPEAFGTPSGYDAIGTFTAPNQTFVSPAFPSGGIGPVAAGWLPAPYGHPNGLDTGATGNDPYNCKAQGTATTDICSGTPFNNLTGGAGSGASSEAYRLWCATDSTRITDWGQLTNLSGAEVPGQGTPIGVPIRIIGVNQGSGTVATFNSFADAGQSNGTDGGNCAAKPYNSNAASGANPFTSDGFTGNLEIALENNASQIGTFAAANWPNDPADQATDIATSLYFQSYGYYNAIPNSGTVQITPGTATPPSGVPLAYVVSLSDENGVAPSIANERTNLYPTARTLFNIWNGNNVTATTGGFLNWICDTNPVFTGGIQTSGGDITKGTDQIFGPNYDQDITTTIQSFGFTRLNDTTPELNVSKLTPGPSNAGDNLVTPNGTCEANMPITATSGSSNTVTINPPAGASGTAQDVPSSIADGWAVAWPANTGAGTAAGTGTVTGTTTTTVTFTVTGGGDIPAGVTTIYFPGHPPVMAVTSPDN